MYLKFYTTITITITLKYVIITITIIITYYYCPMSELHKIIVALGTTDHCLISYYMTSYTHNATHATA